MGFKLSSNVGGLVGGVVGGVAGAFGGNPALGAGIGSQLGSMLGPSEERLAHRQYVEQLRDSISLWNMQNEYNSPLEQRKRLVAAGYNPMLLQGADAASSISQPSYPQVHSSNRGSGFPSSVAKFFLNKQMENAEDQSRTNAINEEYLGLRNELMRAKIQNELTKQNKGHTVKERGIKDLIDEARYLKLLKDLENPYSSGSLTNVRTYQNAFNPNFREVYGDDWAEKEGLYGRKVVYPSVEEASRWRFWNKYVNIVDAIRNF